MPKKASPLETLGYTEGEKHLRKPDYCPFRKGLCTKSKQGGGVCSVLLDDGPVAICPSRFLQESRDEPGSGPLLFRNARLHARQMTQKEKVYEAIPEVDLLTKPITPESVVPKTKEEANVLEVIKKYQARLDTLRREADEATRAAETANDKRAVKLKARAAKEEEAAQKAEHKLQEKLLAFRQLAIKRAKMDAESRGRVDYVLLAEDNSHLVLLEVQTEYITNPNGNQRTDSLSSVKRLIYQVMNNVTAVKEWGLDKSCLMVAANKNVFEYFKKLQEQPGGMRSKEAAFYSYQLVQNEDNPDKYDVRIIDAVSLSREELMKMWDFPPTSFTSFVESVRGKQEKDHKNTKKDPDGVRFPLPVLDVSAA